MVRRFAQHKHGRTNHDEAWKDIEKLWFMPVSKNKDFTQIESDEICRFRASGKRLRNRALNLGHSQPSSLDAVYQLKISSRGCLGMDHTICMAPERGFSILIRSHQNSLDRFLMNAAI